MRSTSIIVGTTISRRTITIVPNSIKTRVRIGSITLNTARALNTRISQQLRSSDSSVGVPGPGQRLQTPAGTVVAQEREGAEDLKPATAAEAEAVRMP
jgi:hypothetical protein